MEPKFQTSFIPKNPVGISTPTLSQYKSVSLLPTLATIVFVLALLISAGMFGYEKLLDSQITNDDKALVLAQAAFDPTTTDQLIVASDQIKSAKNLLNNHVAVSNIFALFEANVLPNVQFTSFTFGRGTTGNVQISVEGEASSYSALAEQSDIFSKIPYMHNQSFNNLDLTDRGTISMKFQTDVDPQLVSYMQAGNTTVTPATTTPIVAPPSSNPFGM